MHEVHMFTQKPVFFSTIRYGEPVPMSDKYAVFSNEVILLSGIARPEPLKAYVEKNFNLVQHFEYRDHYNYTKRDIEKLSSLVSLNPNLSILTTEKDRVKLMSDELKSMIQELPIFYLPIEMKFIKNGKDFDMLVQDFISRG